MMKVLLWLGSLSPLLPLSGAVPVNQARGLCGNPPVRKEWRSLSATEQQSYIKAVQCVLNKEPLTSKDDLPGSTSRYEDYVGDHMLQTDVNHFSGTFYPWHRLFVWKYEQDIRECGFEGGQPYWDWSLDADSKEDMNKSKIWDPVTGFGGNGEWVPGTKENPDPSVPVTADGVPLSLDDRTGGGCIPDGPFANLTTHMGPGLNTSSNPRCVRRDFVPQLFADSANKTVVAAGMAYSDFGYFSKKTEESLHAAGHPGVGGLYGSITDTYTSPADPIFYLHHANLDRAWWSWQSRDLSSRLTDISGPVVPHDWTNQKGENVTLDTTIRTGTTVNVTTTIGSVMDIRQDFLCYSYAELY